MKLSSDYVVQSLVQRGVPEHVARGVARNFQDESGLDSGIQETRPNVHGSKGFGLAQWTDARRIALEDFAKAQGKPVDDPELQLDYFMHENATTEQGAWKSVMNAPNEQEAAVNFVSNWERPAKEHRMARVARYRGDSPSEGGARFGGTGLGDPATAAPAPTYSHPVTDAAPTAPVEKPKTFAEALTGGLGDMADTFGSMGGGGGQASALPRSTVPQVPMGPIGVGAPMAAADTSAQDQLRAQLAQRIALLNSGKLF